MAEGGDLSQTVLGASEEFYDFNCSPCEEDGICKEAHKYCENCKLYYCKKCLGDHNKFPALRAHVIKDVNSQPKTAPTSKTGSSMMSIQASHSEPCEHHPEELIKMYCGEHDLVCCTVCIALDHRECNDVHYILNIANGIRTSKDYNDYIKGLADLRSVHEETKHSILNENKKLSDMKTEIIAEINDYIQELISKIGELGRKSIKRVNERYKQIKERMDLTLDHVDELLRKVTQIERDIKHASEAMLFVNMKRMRLINKEADELNTETENFEGLSFSLGKRILSLLDDSDGLTTTNLPLKLLEKKEYDITNKHLGHRVIDACVLDDDTIVVSCNSTLVRLDRSFCQLCILFPKGKCQGVCKTSNSKELAVAIQDKETVQFVTYSDENMSLTNLFTVGAPCKGICCKDDNIFVACGGGDFDKVLGHIRQYSMNGNLVCTIDTDKTGRQIFTSPRLMTLNTITNDIYITDKDNGIIVLGQDGQMESHSYNSFLKSGFGVCISTKKILVSSTNSYNIQQYDEKFRYVGTLLNFTNKKHRPTCILLDVSRRQLIVCFWNHSKINVYDVEC